MRTVLTGTATALVLGLNGCAGGDRRDTPPIDFPRAEAAINQAEQAGAQRYAGRELNLARQELDQAREAAEDGDLVLAQRLNQRAQVDAELAAALAGNEEMQAAVAELRASLQTLREETQRGLRQ